MQGVKEMNFVFDRGGTVCFNGKSIKEDVQPAIDRLITGSCEYRYCARRCSNDDR